MGSGPLLLHSRRLLFTLCLFEDPDSTSTQALLRHRTLYAFGHVITVKHWKQTPPKRAPSKPLPTAAKPSTPGVNAPPAGGSQPSVYQHAPLDLSWSPAQRARELARAQHAAKKQLQRREGPAT
jgi:hypothetical protein